MPNLGARVTIYNTKGERLARLGDILPGDAPNQFVAPHGVAVDSRGDIYVGEVSWTVRGQQVISAQGAEKLWEARKSQGCVNPNVGNGVPLAFTEESRTVVGGDIRKLLPVIETSMPTSRPKRE
jgi:hypothetical protein